MPSKGRNGGSDKPELSPAGKLPDIPVCRTKKAGFGNYYECLVKFPHTCQWALSFAGIYLCLNKDCALLSVPDHQDKKNPGNGS
jgi:hypothetical protein